MYSIVDAKHVALFGLEDPLQQNVHHVGPVHVHFPHEKRKVGLDRGGVDKDGRQPTGEEAKVQPLTRKHVPGVAEVGAVIVLADGAALDGVVAVGGGQLTMVLLNLVDGVLRQEARETLAIRVQHVTHRVGESRYDRFTK